MSTRCSHTWQHRDCAFIHVCASACMCGRLKDVTLISGGENGKARLVGGSGDPAGAWEYGRLEVLAGGFWSAVREDFRDQAVGRREAEVACRSLGYDGGAQLLVGHSSPFAVLSGSSGLVLVSEVECTGTEASLAECRIDSMANHEASQNDQRVVSLVCANTSGAILMRPLAYCVWPPLPSELS